MDIETIIAKKLVVSGAIAMGKLAEQIYGIDLTTPQDTSEGVCSWFEYIEKSADKWLKVCKTLSEKSNV
jgi:hypothetical protein